jgi:leucyl aminopeptidase
MKMNAILAVNQGSVLPPVLVILEYNKDKKELPLYAVVGKGITFDSGGISIKPAKGMQDMKYDKTGAVTTMGIVKAVSELQLPIRLMGVFAATENMPSGTAQKPGDIITAYNGKTIEVLNTDAEGRLILADALAYTAEKKPEAIIDLATLTGAMIIALGHYRIGLFSNNDKISKALVDAGEKTCTVTLELIWSVMKTAADGTPPMVCFLRGVALWRPMENRWLSYVRRLWRRTRWRPERSFRLPCLKLQEKRLKMSGTSLRLTGKYPSRSGLE